MKSELTLANRLVGIARSVLDAIAVPILAVITAVVIGSALMFAAGYDPILAYSGLADGAFGNARGIARSLLNMTPLVFAGLSVAFAFKGGLFNIGAEGQLFIGAITAAWVGFAFDLPPYIHMPLALLAGSLAGAFWGAMPGFLKAFTGAHEVITTIMFNFIAINLTSWLISAGGENMSPGPLSDPIGRQHALARTPNILDSAKLPVLVEAPGRDIHLGVVLALVVAAIIWFLVWRTTFGFELRMVGLNPSAARYAGVNVAMTTILTMAIAGGLAGMAGAVQTLGVNHRFESNQSIGYGFDSIAVALLGQTHPLGVVLAAFLFGSMNAGTTRMQRWSDVSSEIILVVQALILMFVAADQIIRYIYRIRPRRPEEVQQLSAGWGQR